MNITPTASPAKAGDGVIETHYCCIEGCGKWGGFGFAQSAGVALQWWCERHYPHWSPHIAEKYAAVPA